jgi:hypothetical protein
LTELNQLRDRPESQEVVTWLGHGEGCELTHEEVWRRLIQQLEKPNSRQAQLLLKLRQNDWAEILPDFVRRTLIRVAEKLREAPNIKLSANREAATEPTLKELLERGPSLHVTVKHNSDAEFSATVRALGAATTSARALSIKNETRGKTATTFEVDVSELENGQLVWVKLSSAASVELYACFRIGFRWSYESRLNFAYGVARNILNELIEDADPGRVIRDNKEESIGDWEAVEDKKPNQLEELLERERRWNAFEIVVLHRDKPLPGWARSVIEDRYLEGKNVHPGDLASAMKMIKVKKTDSLLLLLHYFFKLGPTMIRELAPQYGKHTDKEIENKVEEAVRNMPRWQGGHPGTILWRTQDKKLAHKEIALLLPCGKRGAPITLDHARALYLRAQKACVKLAEKRRRGWTIGRLNKFLREGVAHVRSTVKQRPRIKL